MKRALVVIAGLLPAPMLAQEATSPATPFRAGQWAAQFSGGVNLVSLGVLRFTSPGSAWVLDLRGAVQDSDIDVEGVGSGSESFTSLSAVIGRRFYQGRGSELVSFQTIGLSGSYVRATNEIPGGPTLRLRGWNVGALGELGAAYFVTPKFSLGAFATASAFYSHLRSEDPVNRSTDKTWSIQLQSVRFAVTLYF